MNATYDERVQLGFLLYVALLIWLVLLYILDNIELVPHNNCKRTRPHED